jgi:hypothetical protein
MEALHPELFPPQWPINTDSEMTRRGGPLSTTTLSISPRREMKAKYLTSASRRMNLDSQRNRCLSKIVLFSAFNSQKPISVKANVQVILPKPKRPFINGGCCAQLWNPA